MMAIKVIGVAIIVLAVLLALVIMSLFEVVIMFKVADPTDFIKENNGNNNNNNKN